MSQCPLCKENEDVKEQICANERNYCCPFCGEFLINKVVYERILEDEEVRVKISYWIHKQKKTVYPLVLDRSIFNIIKTIEIPKPAEQADNLIIWLGNNQKKPGKRLSFKLNRLALIIGAYNGVGARYVSEELEKNGFIDFRFDKNPEKTVSYLLTFKGWERYDEIKRKGIYSYKAFMAMKFGETELNDFFENHLKAAIKQTGFDLFKLDEDPKAGLIDDNLRVSIRNARFLLADLSHGNKGAYWEAGYAEGLGKQVIYLCKKEVFDNPETKPHFDTNHHLTILWESNNPKQACNDIKATIRVTLPLEAKMEDDKEKNV
jgi:hypothetical protein